jgi:hypothetical protein
MTLRHNEQPAIFNGMLFPKRAVRCLVVPRLYVSAGSLDALDTAIPELLSLKPSAEEWFTSPQGLINQAP